MRLFLVFQLSISCFAAGFLPLSSGTHPCLSIEAEADALVDPSACTPTPVRWKVSANANAFFRTRPLDVIVVIDGSGSVNWSWQNQSYSLDNYALEHGFAIKLAAAFSKSMPLSSLGYVEFSSKINSYKLFSA
ncbi:unnamed protein product, partial [Phaeothamnion confervicola]